MSYFGEYFKSYSGGWWGRSTQEVIIYLSGVYQLLVRGSASFKSFVSFSGLYALISGAKSAEFEQIVSVSGTFSNLLKFDGRFKPINIEYGIFE